MALIQKTDAFLLLWIQEHLRCTPLNWLMTVLAYLGVAGFIWVICGVTLCFFKKTRRAGLCVLLTMGICFLFNDVLIKNVFCRPRPFTTVEGLVVLGDNPTSWSFPSGHACNGFSAAFILAAFFPKKGRWAYVPAVMIALSRPYLGAHYVSDVLVGAFNGTMGAYFCRIAFEKFVNKRTE